MTPLALVQRLGGDELAAFLETDMNALPKQPLATHTDRIVDALVARGVDATTARDIAGNYITACMAIAMDACDRRGVDAWEAVWRA